MTLTTASAASSPEPHCHDLKTLCIDSVNDHGATVRDCFEHAADNIACGRLKREEADAVFQVMAELAQKGDPPSWHLVAPLMFARLDDYYRHGGKQAHGDKAVPGMSALLGMLGHAANQGRSAK